MLKFCASKLAFRAPFGAAEGTGFRGFTEELLSLGIGLETPVLYFFGNL